MWSDSRLRLDMDLKSPPFSSLFYNHLYQTRAPVKIHPLILLTTSLLPISSPTKQGVILSPDADPPVVKIMDYNKYRYEQQKRKRDQQKKSAASRMDLKELKMGYNIDQHDYSVRLKAARKFLKDGDKVKVIVNLKGRENEFRNIAIELIKRFQNDVGELGTEESKNFRDRNIAIVMVPNKAILQKAQEPPKKKDNSATESEVSASV